MRFTGEDFLQKMRSQLEMGLRKGREGMWKKNMSGMVDEAHCGLHINILCM